MKSFLLAIVGAVLFVCLPFRAFAQLDQGQISGMVTDSSNAVVQDAVVKIVSSAKGTTQTTRTDSKGVYSVPNLPVDLYDVVIEGTGFKMYKRTGIQLDAGAHVTISAALELGEISQEVTVASSGAEVQTDTAMVGRTIESAQIKDLALNGRNPINLALTKAGVSGGNFNQFNPDDLGSNGFTINGSSSTENAITLDGVNAVRTRSGTATIGVFNTDAIQQIQILAANYPAEYGRVDGGQIRFVSKSGTSSFHGTAFEFFRNSALDANTWVRNSSPNPTLNSKPDGLRFNQPGFSIGGPIYWPGKWNVNKDKLFFFVAEEWVRFRQQQTNTATVPTALMRAGNFSELLNPANPFTNSAQIVKDPTTGQPFANNIIDPSRLSRNGLALLSAYPLPTPGFQQGASNWIGALPAPRNSRKDFYRVDYYAGRNRYTLTAQHYEYESISPFTSNLDRVGTDQSRPNDTAAFNITSTLSSKWLNDFTISASNELVKTANLESRPYERSLYGIDYPYIFPGTKDVEEKIPTVAITSFTTLDGGPYPSKSSGQVYTLSDNVSWVPTGRHVIKFGAYIERGLQNNRDQVVISNAPGGTNNQNGGFQFSPTGNPQTTGVAIANAALGNFNSYGEISSRAYTLMRSNAFEAFAQDTWKATPWLTIEAGLRYSYFQPWYAKWNDISNFDPNFYSQSNRAIIDPSDGHILSGDAYNGIVLPGSGFPDSAAGHVPAMTVPGVDRLFHNLPRSLVQDYKLLFQPRIGFSARLDPKTVLRGGFGMYADRVNFYSSYLFGNAPNQITVGVTNGSVDNPGGSGGTQRQYPFAMRALDPAYRSPTAYTYSLGLQKEFPGAILFEIGYVGKHSINLRGQRNINQLQPGTVQANPRVNADALRPWEGVGIITLGEYNRQSSYNSLQVSAERRFRNGLSFAAAYTFSKLIDNTTTPYDAYHVNLVRAVSSNNLPHVLNINAIYELPFWKDRTDLVHRIVGGWQVSGVFFLRSGDPLSVVSSVDTAGVGSGSGSQPWNLVGNTGVSDRGLNKLWFNPKAFAAPSAGTFGNAGLNLLKGPTFNDLDFALFKNFSLFDEKLKTQFRAEAFNLPNHPLLADPGVNPNAGSFGLTTSKSGQRNLQLGLKFQF